VRASGITSVVGDVVVDERLFALDPSFEAPPLPIMISDNLIDIVATPGAGKGTTASVRFRPVVSLFVVAGRVATGRAGSAATFTATLAADRRTIKLGGSVPARGGPVVRTVTPPDRPAFARTAFIEALQRAGVSVSAPAVGPNPSAEALARSPGSYPASQRVAAITSAPYAQDVRLILKVSHNPGANLTICLLAVRRGNSDSEAGWASVDRFLKRIGMSLNEVVLGAPDGGSEANRESPRAIIDLLKWWLRQRDFPRFRHSLAVAGVDGTDAGELLHSPARGKLIAKDGLRVAGNALNESPFISGASYTGYMDVGHGHLDAFAVFVNNVPTPDIAQTLRDFEDVFDVSGLLWEKITGQ
jgi:serine-type D-Ala-D-Ala carboxypeptidase/endopeptidase (penicillin-binding protein 4)